MQKINYSTVLEAVTKAGHPVFTNGDYNLNIVGLRVIPGTPNKFDDRICCFYKQDSVWQFHAWEATTDPGTYWLDHLGNVNGTAILIPGHHRSAWKPGLHHGSYEALVQHAADLKVWRDLDHDGRPTYGGKVYTDVQGLNCHHAGTASTQVDKWSAACQVFSHLTDFNQLMGLVHKQIEHGHGNTFSYSLIEWT